MCPNMQRPYGGLGGSIAASFLALSRGLAGVRRDAKVPGPNIRQDGQQADFGKPEVEAHATDIAFSVTEIKHIRKKLASWVEPRKAKLRLKDKP